MECFVNVAEVDDCGFGKPAGDDQVCVGANCHIDGNRCAPVRGKPDPEYREFGGFFIRRICLVTEMANEFGEVFLGPVFGAVVPDFRGIGFGKVEQEIRATENDCDDPAMEPRHRARKPVGKQLTRAEDRVRQISGPNFLDQICVEDFLHQG